MIVRLAQHKLDIASRFEHNESLLGGHITSHLQRMHLVKSLHDHSWRILADQLTYAYGKLFCEAECKTPLLRLQFILNITKAPRATPLHLEPLKPSLSKRNRSQFHICELLFSQGPMYCPRVPQDDDVLLRRPRPGLQRADVSSQPRPQRNANLVSWFALTPILVDNGLGPGCQRGKLVPS